MSIDKNSLIKDIVSSFTKLWSPSFIDKVFEPNVTTKDEGKGTGIGLYMVKQIIDKLEASITVTNKNNGAEFIINI